MARANLFLKKAFWQNYSQINHLSPDIVYYTHGAMRWQHSRPMLENTEKTKVT